MLDFVQHFLTPNNALLGFAYLILLFLIGRTGLIPWLFRQRADRQERLVAQADRILSQAVADSDRARERVVRAEVRIEQLENEASLLRRRLDEDASAARLTIARLVEESASKEAGNRRLRKELIDLQMRDQVLRTMLEKSGKPLPAGFDFPELVREDPKLADLYKELDELCSKIIEKM